jgi:RND family efflux transporter MFP subunit
MKRIIGSVVNVTKSSHQSIRDAYRSAPPAVRKTVVRILLIAFFLVAIIATVKWVILKHEESTRAAEIAAGPQVTVAKVIQSPGEHTITLVGETRPFAEAVLYAKVSGYLKVVKVDKGDKVKQGQVLAVIESAETDQGYEAALADSRNKKAIAARLEKLFAKHLVSQQEIDQARADSDISVARLHTQETLKGYETLRAPFNGTVTARFADPGALVQNATNSQSSALPMVTVSTIDRLRVAVFVDQHDAPYVEKDGWVEITQTDHPGFKIQGKVSRVSGELDPRTKMLLTEIDLVNDNQQLVAGSFVQVALRIKSPPYVQAPVQALYTKDGKYFLTAVNQNNEITFKPIEIANNDGKMLWISSGAQVGDIVALSVGDTIPEGGKVRPLPMQTGSTK